MTVTTSNQKVTINFVKIKACFYKGITLLMKEKVQKTSFSTLDKPITLLLFIKVNQLKNPPDFFINNHNPPFK